MEITKVNKVCENPIQASDIAFIAKDQHRGIRVSNLETSQPERGKPINEVTGIASKRVPNSASFKSKYVLMVGIRDAQVAKLKPEIKKKILKKTRCLPFETMLNFYITNISFLWVIFKRVCN